MHCTAMDDQTVPRILMLVGGVVSLLGLGWSFRRLRRARLMADLPTVTTAGAYVGVLEVAGQVQPLSLVTGPLSQRDGVWVDWSIEEEWKKTETTTDAKGNVRTRTTSGWTTVGGGRLQERFHLKDDQGLLPIEPDGAEVHGHETVDWTLTESDPRYYGLGPRTVISHSTGRRRFQETMVLTATQVWILGHARITRAGDGVEVAADRDVPDYLISVRGEVAERSSATWAWVGGLLLALAGAGGVGYVVQLWPGAAVGAVAALGVWALGWILVAYNSLVALRQRVLQAHANIQVQLQRRADLIPNLVNALQAMQGHERRVQTAVATLRAQAAATLPGRPGADPVALVAIVQSFPELTAAPGTGHLLEALADTENRIALARGFANEVGSALNTRLESIPDGWFARLAGCTPVPLFQADGFSRAAPRVSMAPTRRP